MTTWLITGIVIGVIIDIITALFSRNMALKILPFLVYYIAIVVINEVLKIDIIVENTMQLAKYHQSWVSYLIIMLISACLGGFFWKITILGTKKLDEKTKSQNTDIAKTAEKENQKFLNSQAQPLENNKYILQSAYLGNLKQRTIELSNEIMRSLYEKGWKKEIIEREKLFNPDFVLSEMPDPAKNPNGFREWKINMSGKFYLLYFDQVLEIKNEYSQLHIKNKALDRYYFDDRTINSPIDDRNILSPLEMGNYLVLHRYQEINMNMKNM